MSCYRTGRALPYILVMMLGLLVITVPVVAAPGWYDCSWSYRQSIVIDRTKVAGSLTNFPVLISLASDSSLASHARADGYDIVFTSSDGTTRLSHQIESYSGSTGALVAWVTVPAVSSSSNTVLYMYYGNPGSSNQQNAANVWSNGYRGVWHLGEGGTGARYDSTSNGNNLKPRNYAGNEGATGQIDGADSLNGARKYLESAGNIGITGCAARTITFWAKLANTNRCGMVGWGANAMESEFEAAVRMNSYFLWGYGYGNDWEYIATPQTGIWNYHAITYDGDTARWYLNGAQIGSGFEFDYDTADSHVFIGYESDNGQSSVTYMNGVIDEVRVASKSRSSSWIRTEYNNQNSPSTFSSMGSEMYQPQSCAPTPDPTATPTPVPTTVEPTETPTPVPTTAEPTETPTPVPTTVEPTETPTPVPTTAEPTPTPAPAFSCPTGTYSLVTAEGETSGCVAISNDWAFNATSNLVYNTLFVTFTAADSTCLTGADLAVSLDLEPVEPQFQQVFDPAACTTSYTFSIELPSNLGDIPCLYVSASGTVRKVTDGVSSADIEVSAPQNPIEYFLQL